MIKKFKPGDTIYVDGKTATVIGYTDADSLLSNHCIIASTSGEAGYFATTFKPTSQQIINDYYAKQALSVPTDGRFLYRHQDDLSLTPSPLQQEAISPFYLGERVALRSCPELVYYYRGLNKNKEVLLEPIDNSICAVKWNNLRPDFKELISDLPNKENRQYAAADLERCIKASYKPTLDGSLVAGDKVKSKFNDDRIYTYLGVVDQDGNVLLETDQGTSWKLLKSEFKELIKDLPNKENRRYGALNRSYLSKIPNEEIKPMPIVDSEIKASSSSLFKEGDRVIFDKREYLYCGCKKNGLALLANESMLGAPYKNLTDEEKTLVANLPNKEKLTYVAFCISSLKKAPSSETFSEKVAPIHSRITYQDGDSNRTARVVVDYGNSGTHYLVADDKEKDKDNFSHYSADQLGSDIQDKVKAYLNNYPKQKNKKCFRWIKSTEVQAFSPKWGDIVEYGPLQNFTNSIKCQVIGKGPYLEKELNKSLDVDTGNRKYQLLAYIDNDKQISSFKTIRSLANDYYISFEDLKKALLYAGLPETTPVQFVDEDYITLSEKLMPTPNAAANSTPNTAANSTPEFTVRTRVSYDPYGSNPKLGYVVIDDKSISASVAIAFEEGGYSVPENWTVDSIRSRLNAYLDKYGSNSKRNVFQFVDRRHLKVVPTPVSNEEKTMSNEKPSAPANEKPSLWEMVKSDGKEAGYRMAATQMVNVVRTGVCAAMQKKGAPDGHVQAVGEFLKTDIGFALISVLLGMVVPQLPKVGEDPRVSKICEEFRVNGMTTAGNAVVSTAMEYLLPALQDALKNLPAMEEENKARVSVEHHNEAKKEHMEEEETQATQGKTAVA